VVERLLAKEEVASSTLVFRSTIANQRTPVRGEAAQWFPVEGAAGQRCACLLAKEEVASSTVVFRASTLSSTAFGQCRSGGIGRRDGLKNR
jgi:hypothetical protein